MLHDLNKDLDQFQPRFIDINRCKACAGQSTSPVLAELSPAEKRVYPGRSGAAHCGEYLHICNNAAHTPGSIVSMQIKTAPGIFTRCDRVTGTGGEG